MIRQLIFIGLLLSVSHPVIYCQQPDYENNDNKIPDKRTTIYWNPEVQTDSTGKVKVSFYNSDLKGEAQIRISGVSYQLKDASSTISHYLSH